MDSKCVVFTVQCHRLMPVNKLRMLKVVWLIQSVLCLLCAVSQTHASEQIEDVEGCLVDSKCVVFTVCSVADSCQ